MKAVRDTKAGVWTDWRGLVLLSLWLLSFTLYPQDAGLLPTGGLSQKGLGGMSTFGEAAWSATCDPAALPDDGNRLTLMLGQPYGLSGLFTAGAALALKQGNALFGAGIIRSGDGESALTRMAMSVGLALHERLRAGSGVSMMINRWAAELPPALSPGLTLSLMYEADHRLSLQMMSALRLPLTNDPYRPRYMMCLLSGARYAVAESFVLRFELERLSSGRLGIRGGLEANAGKHHRIYAGADPGTQRFSIGWAWRIGRSVVGFATEHHPLLGNSPWLAWEQGIGRNE